MSSHSTLPERLFDRFKLQRLIGRGGMGDVYLAEDELLHREVAIKCVEKRNNSSKLIARLRREAQVLAQLNCSSIVQLYDLVENEDLLGLVIEYVNGPTMYDRIRDGLPDQATRIKWLIDLCYGLHEAHQADIIHCDLKLQNILIGESDTIKIADFGIAKARIEGIHEHGDITEFDNVSGSYFSMSPEQIAGENVDFRTDLFSLGILIHMVLTGRHPFGETNNHLEMVDRIRSHKFEHQESSAQYMTSRQVALIEQLLEKQAHKRPTSALIVAQALESDQHAFAGFDSFDRPTTLLNIPGSQTPAGVNDQTRTGLNQKSLLALATIILITIVFYLQINKPSAADVYVMVADTKLTISDDSQKSSYTHIAHSVNQSINEAIIGATSLRLIPSKSLNVDEPGSLDIATRNAADLVIYPFATCDQQKCEFRIDLLSQTNSKTWQVVNQQSWPSVSRSLLGIRESVLDRATQAISNHLGWSTKTNHDAPLEDISEQTYQAYLELHQDSQGGSSATEEQLNSLRTLITSSPNFLPAYDLYTKYSIHLYKRSGDQSILDSAQYLFDRAFGDLSNNPYLLKLNFELHIANKNYQSAAMLIERIEKVVQSPVLINDLRARIAYAQGDLERGAILDLQNVKLRPTSLRYYNLAVSQFMLGDYEQAKESIEQSRRLTPDYAYAKNLQAAIELTLGNLDAAIAQYEEILSEGADSEAYSNYGLALMLKGRNADAIQAHRSALQAYNTNPGYMLNLADSLKLNGDIQEAESLYLQVSEMVPQPDNVQEYVLRSQSLAHLGQTIEAVRNIKMAIQRYPDVADLNYSASLVSSLAGNDEAALVEMELALQGGIGVVWFQLNWFTHLCAYPAYQAAVDKDVCKDH